MIQLMVQNSGVHQLRLVVEIPLFTGPKDHLTLQWKGLNLRSRGWVLKMTPLLRGFRILREGLIHPRWFSHRISEASVVLYVLGSYHGKPKTTHGLISLLGGKKQVDADVSGQIITTRSP